ncbi:MAG: cation:proton antiporter [Mariprofundaceae bacterium]
MPATLDMLPTEAFATAIFIAVVAQLIATRFNIPSILLWLLAGMALGPFGLHVIHPEAIGYGLQTLIELGLAVIMFEGGLNLNFRALKEYGRTIAKLAILGPIITISLAGWAAHFLLDISWTIALLFGALAALSGPTVITPIVRQVRMDRQLRHILTGEAMLVEIIGALLAILILQLVLNSTLQPISLISDFCIKLVIGAAVGGLGAWLLSKALLSSWLKDSELRSTATLATTWGMFVLADHLSAQSGLLATLLAGMILQRMNLPDIQRLRYFKASLSMLLISVLFVLLAANLNLVILMKYLWEGVALFVLLVLIIRPLTSILAATGGHLNWRQIAYLSCMAPKGVVAAAITSMFALVLQQHGFVEGDLLLSIVYIMIILSIFFYGLLAAPLSRWLRVDGGDDRSVLIIGGGQIGAELGRVLGDDREVRFLDMNLELITTMQLAGYRAVRGNALDPLYMELINAEEVNAVIVMTGSTDHNLLIARMAYDDFHVRNVYVAMQEGDHEKHARLIHQLQAKRLFAKPYNFTYWNDQAYRKRLVFETRTIDPQSPLINHALADIRIPHGVQPMSIIRAGETIIPSDHEQLQEGDQVCLLLRPERIQEGQPLLMPPSSSNSSAFSKLQAPGEN